MKIAGVILAGGQSRRMGGVEKSLLQLDGREQISLLIERLEPQVSSVLINANGDPARFDFAGLPVRADTVDGSAGPLAGILTAMQWAGETGASHVMTAATDTPFIPSDLVARLAATIDGDNTIAMASSNDRIHPVFGLWPKTLAKPLENFLVVEDKRKILEFAERYPLHEVVFGITDHDPFFNINTPRDLEVAKAIAEAEKT